MKKQQQRIEMVLGKNYQGTEVKYIDVAADEDAKKKMREIAGDDKAVPPQICNGDTYCGVSPSILSASIIACRTFSNSMTLLKMED